jgi:hypothetical protein
MPFEGTSQDSRDPNSPQWGYLKVKDPEKQLLYPAKDDKWNEYVLFVHNKDDASIRTEELKIQEGRKGIMKIPPRTDLECVMVPAKLTIGNHEQLIKEIDQAMEACDSETDQKIMDELQKTRKFLDGNQIDEITIPTSGRVPDSTTLWVALVVGPK